MLKVRYKNLQRDAFWIIERNYAIGRAADNHLNLEHPSVDPHHLRISRDKDVITVRDLNSASGTYINGRRVSVQPIVCGDVLRIGDVELEIVDPIAETLAAGKEYWSLVGSTSWLAGQEFPLVFRDGAPLLLGRGKHCDIVFPGTHLSREHARITRISDNLLRIEDLKSINATFVNDEKTALAEIRAGDQIRLDVYSFWLFGPGINLHKSATRPPKSRQPPKNATVVKSKTTSKPLPPHQRRWKTAPTSPGNREETVSAKTPAAHWLLAVLLLVLLLIVIARVLLSSV